MASAKCKFCEGGQDLVDCQFYCEITVDDRSSFLKKNTKTYSTIMHKQKKLKSVSGKASDRTTWFKIKNKKPQNEVDNKNETGMKSNCAGIGNGATHLGEVIIVILFYVCVIKTL